MAENKKVVITLVKSPIGGKENQKATLKALGLNKMHASVEKYENNKGDRQLHLPPSVNNEASTGAFNKTSTRRSNHLQEEFFCYLHREASVPPSAWGFTP